MGVIGRTSRPYSSIYVHKETIDRLNSLKVGTESYEHIINRLIDIVKPRNEDRELSIFRKVFGTIVEDIGEEDEDGWVHYKLKTNLSEEAFESLEEETAKEGLKVLYDTKEHTILLHRG